MTRKAVETQNFASPECGVEAKTNEELNIQKYVDRRVHSIFVAIAAVK